MSNFERTSETWNNLPNVQTTTLSSPNTGLDTFTSNDLTMFDSIDDNSIDSTQTVNVGDNNHHLSPSSKQSKGYFHRFIKFHGFAEDPKAPILQEFDRLAKSQGWMNEEGDEVYDQYFFQKDECLLDQFKVHFPSSDNTIEDAQRLCAEVGMPKIPDTIQECKDVCARLHLCI